MADHRISTTPYFGDHPDNGTMAMCLVGFGVTDMPTIHLNTLGVGYGQQNLIQPFNLTIPAGTLLAIVGTNGTGKSTLLKTLVGEIKPLQGQVKLHNGKPADIAYLPQRHHVDQRFPISVQDFVAMGLWRQVGAFSRLSIVLRQRIDAALEKLGLQDQAHASLANLSGGQMQRALFARLVLQEASVILLDEPFTAIDQETTADLLQLLIEWQQEKRTVMSVLHDWGQVSQYFPETLLLHQQKAIHGPTEQILAKPPHNLAA